MLLNIQAARSRDLVTPPKHIKAAYRCGPGSIVSWRRAREADIRQRQRTISGSWKKTTFILYLLGLLLFWELEFFSTWFWRQSNKFQLVDRPQQSTTDFSLKDSTGTSEDFARLPQDFEGFLTQVL